MFKKLLQAGITFTLLLGCYFGYVRAFAYLVDQLKADRPDDDVAIPIHSSRSKQYAQQLARLAFGARHWTVTNDQPYAYYNAERGFWIFALQVDEVEGYNGKRLHMYPFAMIWKSSDGKNVQMLTAESAVLDLNQPIALSSKQNTGGLKVKHAHIERNVRIRDDRGTPLLLADDMNIGPMTYLDFDDATQQITTESHVVIVDPDQTIIGDGLEIQLRRPDPDGMPSSSSGGFGGVEYAILLKNHRVTLRDVGDSGVFPSNTPSKKAAPAKAVEVVAGPSASKSGAQGAKPAAPVEPVPLYIQGEGKMRYDQPPDRLPVAVGPPAPPAPTLVRFERNVVALHGRPDKQPNQLDCDTLRLTLIPGAQPSQAEKDKAASPQDAPASSGPTGIALAAVAGAGAADGADAPTAAKSGSLFGNLVLQKLHATGHAVWLQLREQGSKVRCNELVHNRLVANRPDTTQFRGDRTRPIWLEKVNFEPEEADRDGAGGEKDRLARSDSSPKPARKISSVTHVVTVSATLYDRGTGMDLADVRAFGPGRLETRPDPTEPVERVAVWQDELIIVNVPGDDGKLKQKQVTLTGTRPFFLDIGKKTAIDAGREIKVFLKPKSPTPGDPARTASASGALPAVADRGLAASPAARPVAAGGDPFAENARDAAKAARSTTGAPADSGLGGSLQIEKLLAFRDVHLKAPSRYMEAREWLDATFIEVDPPPSEESTEAIADGAGAGGADAEGPPSADEVNAAPRAQDAAKANGEDVAKDARAQAAKDAEPETPPEPAMSGMADRIRALVEMPRGKSLDDGKSKRRKAKARAADAPPAVAEADATAPANGMEDAGVARAGAPKPKQAEADIRTAWLFGNVALHQDVPPDSDKPGQAKPKGNDVFGEAVYLDNRGKGKVNARVYYRDPTALAPRPGPIPWAKVSTDDMTIRGEIIWMDQERDKVYAYGPGVLTQWTDRSLKNDQTPEAKPGAGAAGAGNGAPLATTNARRTVTPVAITRPAPGVGPQLGATGETVPGGAAATVPARRAGSPPGPNDQVAAKDQGPANRRPAAPPKPRTRAGRRVADKDLLTISWTKQMEFDGRTKDPHNRPCGRADFLGIVHAEMTDMLLHCEQKMIVFTDREVPLAELSAARPGSKSKAGGRQAREVKPQDGDEELDDAPPRASEADLSLIYCFGNPVAISRKVDPDAPIVLEKQRIDAFDREKRTAQGERKMIPGRLDYNRLTGEFYVPGPGIVYLYDRPDETKKEPANAPEGPAAARQRRPADGGPRRADDRMVTPTSARFPDGDSVAGAPAAPRAGQNRANVAGAPADRGAARNRAAEPAAPVVRRKISDMVLMQVEFSTEMRGRMGNGQADDRRQTKRADFFGNIELLRSKVANDGVMLDPDKELPEDGFYLTSQMLRIIQVPPPPGSSEKTPARTLAKAWDEVHVNKGANVSIVSDVGTYDSSNNVIWAYGEGGREVTMIEQFGAAQPITSAPAKAVQYNVKTHNWRTVDGNTIRLVDGKTGGRPYNIPQPDPTAQARKRRKQPYKVPNTNLERRGFTGF